ncbi:iron-sulfur cluster assembly scaffold protein [Candidatus Peregrinibacteria bacterium]|nr:MAG: iron-sulfur cluster assembly scaffold protein [Candidatus Peregrinibacteria bacterium]
MDIYAQTILDRYKEPYYKDKKLDATVSHSELNRSCGDEAHVSLRLDGDKIAEYTFAGAGCAISQAAADLLGDVIIDLSVDEVLNLTKETIYEVLGIEISLRRSKCALLALLAVQNALLKHRGGELRNWTWYHL